MLTSIMTLSIMLSILTLATKCYYADQQNEIQNNNCQHNVTR